MYFITKIQLSQQQFNANSDDISFNNKSVQHKFLNAEIVNDPLHILKSRIKNSSQHQHQHDITNKQQ